MNDILIVSPYNARLGEISSRCPDISVGTVDNFQGREVAAIVVISLATSTPEEARRGMDFLYTCRAQLFEEIGGCHLSSEEVTEKDLESA